MPVTAKLSRKFYERLGDEIATELVDWFNAVDAAYRADLERLNELNFQRFDAKVEQRFAEADAKVEQRFAEADAKVEKRFAAFEVKMEKRFAEFEQRFAAFEVKIEKRLADTHVEMSAELASTRDVLADRQSRMMRWMFGFWVGTLVPLAGLILTLRLL